MEINRKRGLNMLSRKMMTRISQVQKEREQALDRVESAISRIEAMGQDVKETLVQKQNQEIKVRYA